MPLMLPDTFQLNAGWIIFTSSVFSHPESAMLLYYPEIIGLGGCFDEKGTGPKTGIRMLLDVVLEQMVKVQERMLFWQNVNTALFQTVFQVLWRYFQVFSDQMPYRQDDNMCLCLQNLLQISTEK